MKDLSLFLLKNSFGSKMKKGFRNFCNGESSTSTLDQHKVDIGGSSSACMAERPRVSSPLRESHPTLEEMILQLEMEEKMARKGKLDGYGGFQHRRSCVNSSDILRSARNALNQYPRFSLDGKDAMYRSSFTDLAPIRAGKLIQDYDLVAEKTQRLPSVIGGESVIWCKPGVVGKLMGLDAMPIPLNRNYRRERLSAIIKRQNLHRRAEKHEMERRRRPVADTSVGVRTRRGVVGSCSRTGYCVMKPVELEIPSAEAGRPMRRFL